MALYPQIPKNLKKVAKEQGLNVYPETLRCEVQGGLKGPLADHQLEKANLFTKEFISMINKKP